MGLSVARLVALLLLGARAVGGAVLELTADNFADAVKTHDIVLVEFYSPTCPACLKLAPEYEKASESLAALVAAAAAELGTAAATTAVLAKIDVPAHAQFASQFRIENFPTLRLFRNGYEV